MRCPSSLTRSAVPKFTSIRSRPYRNCCSLFHWSLSATNFSFASSKVLFRNSVSRPPSSVSTSTTLSPSAELGHLQSSFSVVGLLATASLALGATLYFTSSRAPASNSTTTLDDRVSSNAVEHLVYQMASESPSGRLGNLTPEQEAKLREFWTAISQLCNVLITPADALGGESADAVDGDDNEGVDTGTATPTTGEPLGATASSISATDGKKNDKKKKRNIFKRSKKDSDLTATAADVTSTQSMSKSSSTASDLAAAASIADDDKYGQGKLFQNTVASETPESIRATIWSMVKHDHPDALVLRFLRARKWDVNKALVMLVSTMHWRAHDMHVDDDIMQKGEGGAAEEIETGADGPSKTVSRDFLAQLRMGKSFLHGVDKENRPVCVVRVRLHHQGDQVEESVERCTVYTIETARMALQPPVDTATIIFDMTGFSLANMDYSPVKFMIKCFEANYPESLGAVLVHKSPWLFQSFWRIIRGWLDPVVARKVHFTNNVKDLEQFISKDKIPKDLDGDEDWKYTYPEPEPGENDKMKDTVTRDKLLAEREALYAEFEVATAQWILHPDGEQTAAIKTKRDGIAQRMRDDYWRLDPYVRARSMYDRIGMLQPGGKVDFYPQLKKDEVTQTDGNAQAQVSTSSAN